jgi:hypothetical protein
MSEEIMGRGRWWTEAEVARACELRDSGLNYVEIGKALDRTPVAVKDAIARHQPSEQMRVVGAPLGVTSEDRHFANDAIQGSAQLLAEIERVFGQRRAA